MTTHTQYKRQRKSIRLKEYDYAQPGMYFVTVCSSERVLIFGDVVDGKMVLNEFGRIVETVWNEIPRHFSCVEIDAFIVMPNHIHGIIEITGEKFVDTMDDVSPDNVEATHASPLPPLTNPRGPKPRSIGAIVGSFKSAASKRINESRNTPGMPIWQRNYYEHIIRDDNALTNIRTYIQDNPQKWILDTENPINPKSGFETVH